MRILNDIFSSFYASDFYADVAYARKGIGMKFIFALTLIMVGLITGYLLFYSGTLNEYAQTVPKFAAELPKVTVKDGKLSIDRPGPFSIPVGGEGQQVWIVIDTSYKVGDLKVLKEHMEKNNIIMLITEEELITLKEVKNELEIKQISEFRKDFTVTHQDWMDIANYIAEKGVRTLIWTVLLGGFVFFFLYNLFATFMSALVMMILGFILRGTNHEFGTLMRLTAAARIPFNAITALPMMIGGGLITGGLSWLIWFGYLAFAVVATKRHA